MNQFKKAKVIMLPKSGEKLQTKCDCKNSEESHHYHCGLVGQNNKIYLNGKSINLYIVSDDKIEKGDYFYNTELKTIVKATSIKYPNERNKIIATTDTLLFKLEECPVRGADSSIKYILPQPSQEFIKQYIETYNRGKVITDILVEYEGEKSGCLNYKGNGGTQCDIPCDNAGWCPDNRNNLKLKINQDETINIKLPKDSWTREEVEKLCRDAWRVGFNVGQNDEVSPSYLTEEDWVKENL